LIIGTTQHRCRPFSRLPPPELDLQGLRAVLSAPELGGFEAPMPLCDQPAFNLGIELESFFRDREPEDVLLLYVAGHVLLDERGAPCLITRVTERGRWRSSVIDFAFLRDVMDQCRSEQQVLIVDCALGSLGAAGPAIGTRVDVEAALGGPGRTVLSASSNIAYRLGDDSVVGDASAAALLGRIVHGLQSGDADLDGDGRVSLADLAAYVERSGALPGTALGARHAGHGAGGSLVIARRSPTRREPMASRPALPLPLGAGAHGRWTWASQAASSVASWLSEHVGR
jgi:hypothetical protein